MKNLRLRVIIRKQWQKCWQAYTTPAVRGWINSNKAFIAASRGSGLSGFKHRRLNDCLLPFQPSSVNQWIVTLSFTDIDVNNKLLQFARRQETRGPTLFLRELITRVRKNGKADWVREVLCYNGDHFFGSSIKIAESKNCRVWLCECQYTHTIKCCNLLSAILFTDLFLI